MCSRKREKRQKTTLLARLAISVACVSTNKKSKKGFMQIFQKKNKKYKNLFDNFHNNDEVFERSIELTDNTFLFQKN